MNFMKTGAAAHEEHQKADLERIARYAPFRFFIKEGKKTKVTFLDGALLEGGILALNSFYEHMIPRGAGRSGFDNYCCTKEQEQCPICEEGEFSTLVSAFTVLDHTKWEDKNGKTHEHEKKLYVCKGDTVKRLQDKATMYGGLVGVTFQVGRIGKTSASVGSDYDYIEKTPIADIETFLNLKPGDLAPLDYSKEIKYLTADELRKIGFGVSKGASVGAADAKAFPTEQKAAAVGESPFKSFNPAKHM